MFLLLLLELVRAVAVAAAAAAAAVGSCYCLLLLLPPPPLLLFLPHFFFSVSCSVHSSIFAVDSTDVRRRLLLASTYEKLLSDRDWGTSGEVSVPVLCRPQKFGLVDSFAYESGGFEEEWCY